MAGYTNLDFFKGTLRQRERGLGALPGKIAGTAFPIFRKYVLRTAKKTRERCIRGCSSGTGGSDRWQSLNQEGNKTDSKENREKVARRRETEENQSNKTRNDPSH